MIVPSGIVSQADQIFVTLQHLVAGYFPVWLQPIVMAVLAVVAIVLTFPLCFALSVWLERKALGRIQNRLGPNRVGPFGLLQPIADAIKSLTKEDIVPLSADALVHFLAPVILVVVTFLGYAVLPVGRNMVLLNMDCGIFFFFAIGASTELSIFMAGWSSRNKYSLLGAMRAVAQMISYEVPLLLSAVVAVMMTGSLSTVKIVEAQSGFTGIFPHWYVFTPWGFLGFILFVIAALAETNRSPFDLPEGESELVAGYFTEYSGFKFALFFLGEYLGMLSIAGFAITLFLGGWGAPLSVLGFVPSWAWFFVKLAAGILFFIWLRGTMPRLRQDQLMNFAWKFVLPMSLLNLVVAGAWRFMPDTWLRWVVSAGILGCAYVLLGRILMRRQGLGPRSYRYAE